MNPYRNGMEAELRSQGTMTAAEIARALGVSQPTVSRLCKDMGRQRLQRLGRGRATRYGLTRNVRNLGSAWPLYRVAPDGTIYLIGRLHALEAGQWYLEQNEPWTSFRGSEFRDGVYPGLPWFISDMKPQGFLGRCFARKFAAGLNTSPDPQIWNDDDILAALVRFGEDMQGDLVVGETALNAIQSRVATNIKPDPVFASNRTSEYPARADAILASEWPGSSAAGEQPKFTACVKDAPGDARHVIVKFSGRTNSRPEDLRWADLLIAEHVANTVLIEAGIPCAETTILQAGNRTFLESSRFDRVGMFGRLGLVSLAALDSAFFGQIDSPWTKASDRLRDDGWISDKDADRLNLLWWFGTLIGNTDMHYGNISLFMEPRLPLSLAPAYDMTPMLYRPDIEGSFSNTPLSPSLPPPEAHHLWVRAASLARNFWTRLARTEMISSTFRAVAGQNSGIIGANSK